MFLQIPTNKNTKTRQTIWRVFVVLALCAAGLGLGLSLAYIAYHRDRTTALAPSSATLALRIIKNPTTNKISEELFKDTSAKEGTSLSLSSLIEKSRREYTIYFNDIGEVVGFATDTDLDLSKTELTKNHIRSVALPWSGQLVIQQDETTKNIHSPIRFSMKSAECIKLEPFKSIGMLFFKEGILIKENLGDISASGLQGFSPKNTPLLALAIPPTTITAFLSDIDIPLTHSGTRALMEQARIHGVALEIGTDGRGTTIAIRVPKAENDVDKARQLLHEWSASMHTDPNTNEVKDINTAETNIVTANQETTITQHQATNGEKITLSTSNEATTITNRQTSIEDSNPREYCGKYSSAAFIKTSLLSHVPTTMVTKSTQEKIFAHTKKILWTSDSTIFCFEE
jgi:hypothetical protein